MRQFVPMQKGQPNWSEKLNDDVGYLYDQIENNDAVGYTKAQLDAQFTRNTQEHDAMGARIDALREAIRQSSDGSVFFESVDSVRMIRGNYNEILQHVECTKGV